MTKYKYANQIMQELAEYTLGYSGTKETNPFAKNPGVVVIKAFGKMCVIFHNSTTPIDEAITVKLGQELSLEYMELFKDDIKPAWHMNHAKRVLWVSVNTTGAVSKKEIKHLIDISYGLISGKRAQKHPDHSN